MAETNRVFAALLKRIRAICLSLPDAYEGEVRGDPAFLVGRRVFAGFGKVIPWGPTIRFRLGMDRRNELLKDARFFPTPYATHLGWVSMKLRSGTKWNDVEALIREAYHRAGKRIGKL
jgi:predicted DNA-binding protein (MmcQ/YjbR family)